ncbi:hypothetical protein Rsub_11974 [Raphidocelis subcapitata]|uniref:Sugar phosphate transporter domain-containing protein n=1 Tax=Raphidocelis subcapitata TaxID=307507 RepID=A0A2V0PHH9_9CHLO|nr:hypothetical protein Rsub_11974 [Raphidocelis subcapitata]|eukprot:GBF99029.1 hypothetical protein Rsub_11974 [Raphidocelis subcapitata]
MIRAKSAAGSRPSIAGDVEEGAPLITPQSPVSDSGAGRAGGAPQWLLTAGYGVTNLASVVTIVVANKKVLYTHKFSFVVTLTLLHSVFTAAGMLAMGAGGVFQPRRISRQEAFKIAAVYVGFIVANNLSIQLNPLGFYQMSKLSITPVLVFIEWVWYAKPASPRVLASIAVLMVGVGLCSVSDVQLSSNPAGVAAAVGAVLVAALYQVWAGAKQKELGLNGMQLLHQVSPASVVLLVPLAPLLEPFGIFNPRPGTVLGYRPSPEAVAWILGSSVLGLIVTLSTFLFIGATSSLTYNVVGHLKTVLIVGSGVAFFGEGMGVKKGVGLVVALCGIFWYSHIKLEESRKADDASK